MGDLPAGVSAGLWVLSEACGRAHCDVTVQIIPGFDKLRVKHNRTKGTIRNDRQVLEDWLRETHELEAKS